MEYSHEIINFKTLPVKFFLHRIGDVNRHWHQSIELIVVLKGNVAVTVNDYTHRLKDEDLILINSNSIHELHGDNATMVALQIRLDSLDNLSKEIKNLHYNCNSTSEKDPSRIQRIRQIVVRLLKYNTNANDYIDIINISLVYSLIFELCANFVVRKEDLQEFRSIHNLDRLSRILNYINNNYQEDIKLESLAAREFLSLQYLSRFFNHNVGMPFSTYLKNVRLQHAIRDLSNLDFTIEQIAANNGFPNTRSFVTSFKEKYNETPSLWRKKFEQPMLKNLEFSKDKLFNYLEDDPDQYRIDLNNFITANDKDELAPSIPQNDVLYHSLDIDVSTSKQQLRHHFKNFIGFSRAKELLSEGNREILRTMQREIGFKYIKMHGLLSDDMMVYHERHDGKPIYNFNLIDNVFDFLMDQKLKPLVQFSFMPRALAKKPDKSIFYSEFIISEPKDMNKWNMLVIRLIEHLIGRYGSSEVRSWLFNVWNEPSSSNALFGFENDDLFYSLYQNTYSSVKSVDSSLLFGGPSSFSTYGKNEDWLFAFLEFTRANGCKPDFINVHYYDIDLSFIHSPDVEQIKKRNPIFLSPIPDSFSLFVERLYARLEQTEFKDTPVYLTEWNSTVSHKDLMNDTCFKSAYIVKNILENYDRFHSFGYWLVNDMHEEFLLPAETFHGGLGMFTVNNIKKPAYHAFFLLNKLGDTLIDRGDGYFITKQEGKYQILLYNYHHYSQSYAKEIWISMSYDNRYSDFTAQNDRKFSFVLSPITGMCSLTHYIVNRAYGSAYDNLIALGDWSNPSREEINYLRNISIPKLEKQRITADNALNIDVTLKPFEIRLIEIDPIYKPSSF